MAHVELGMSVSKIRKRKILDKPRPLTANAYFENIYVERGQERSPRRGWVKQNVLGQTMKEGL